MLARFWYDYLLLDWRFVLLHVGLRQHERGELSVMGSGRDLRLASVHCERQSCFYMTALVRDGCLCSDEEANPFSMLLTIRTVVLAMFVLACVFPTHLFAIISNSSTLHDM
jgi:hypothetical protein